MLKNKNTTKKGNRKIVTSVLIILFLSFGFFGYVYYTGNEASDLFSFEKIKNTFLNENNIEAKGNILLTLRHNDGESYPDIFSYDIESGSLKRSIDHENINVNINSKLSYNKEVLAFVSFPQKNWSEYLQQIYVYNKDTKESKEITKSDKTSRKRLPEWSPNGEKIAFTGWTPKEGEPSVKLGPVEQYGVYVTDLEGNEKFITNGAYPKWLPFGENLILVKNDGIHLYDINGTDQGLIWDGEGGIVYSNNHIDVSNDGLKIAWSSPDWGEVAIMFIDSWSPFEVKDVSIIETHAFWPKFSPDSENVLLQEVDWEELESDPDPELVLYNLENLKSSRMLKLNDFDQNYTFLTDWRY